LPCKSFNMASSSEFADCQVSGASNLTGMFSLQRYYVAIAESLRSHQQRVLILKPKQ
jgi:hypothetical protein